MNEENKRMQILEMIERGDVSAEEGVLLLQELNQDAFVEAEDVSSSIETEGIESAASAEEQDQFTHINQLQEIPAGFSGEAAASESVRGEDAADSGGYEAYTEPVDEDIPQPDEDEVWSATASQGISENIEKWRRWWMIPLYIGIGITVLAGLFMLWAFQASGIGFWFLCTSVFFAFGLIVVVLAAQSRTSRWLHLRIKQKPGERPQNIAISLPLPLRFASWMTHIFGRFMPNMQGASPNDILFALDAVDDSVSVENPIYIEVDDEDGERVEIFIG